ncbi:uncharacterized protein LOC143054716 [Mytilus galloprovincialis]|uniref:uncharacterized protein LOC143054716 n=1 Tax=Mytilus galloprovincialis TaxID=29158 RepID=UPI003F7B617E
MCFMVLSALVVVLGCANGFLLVPDGFQKQPIKTSQACRTGNNTFCYPGMNCWPSQSEIAKFSDTFKKGDLLLPSHSLYRNLTVMKNLRVTKYPAMIAVVKDAAEIQECLYWARSKSMHIVVQSSGHDFQGRSTADGAFMIYLGNMTEISIKLNSTRKDCPYGEIVLGSGNQWQTVYKELDKVDRVMIGGSAHTVAIGGYTLGGGHSPISRMYGLAVDNLLEVEMITADSRLVVANDNGTTSTDINGQTTHSSNTDLIWASRGGGGGTFGVATKFTFRLHEAPKKMVRFSCNFPMYLAAQKMNVYELVTEKFFSILPDMPKQWGGYFFLSIYPFQFVNQVGSVSFFFNHFGDWDSPSRAYMDHLLNFRPDLQRSCSYENLTSFWDYEKDVNDALYIRSDIIGTLVQKEGLNSSDLIEFLRKHITSPKSGALTGMTAILLGGKMMEVGPQETSVHPGFRKALMTLGIGASWGGNGDRDDEFSQYMQGLNAELEKFGNGSYPNESTGKSPTWKQDFWGSNYARLEQIKKTWDPNNVFMCQQCVGWDRL